MHANDCWNSWTATNAALERRSNEVMDAKQRLQMHLHKVNDLFNLEVEKRRREVEVQLRKNNDVLGAKRNI